MNRIDKMLQNWQDEGRAFSNLSNNDNDFFQSIGIPYENLGVTSQYGLDIVYFNTEMYENDTNALRKIKK